MYLDLTMKYLSRSTGDTRQQAAWSRGLQFIAVEDALRRKARELVSLFLIYVLFTPMALLASNKGESELLVDIQSDNKGAAFVAARALGRLESARGLQKLIDRHDKNLLQEYVSGFKDAAIIKNHTLPPFPLF
jgi:hypothetical protein